MDSLTSKDMIMEFQKKINESINMTQPLNFYNPQYAGRAQFPSQVKCSIS